LDEYILQHGQIHFVTWTKTICNFNKYILQLGQICFVIWTNTFSNLNNYIFATWTNTFYSLDKYVLKFEQKHFPIWTNTCYRLVFIIILLSADDISSCTILQAFLLSELMMSVTMVGIADRGIPSSARREFEQQINTAPVQSHLHHCILPQPHFGIANHKV